MTMIITLITLFAASIVHANINIPQNYFTDNNGIEAAEAAAPYAPLSSSSSFLILTDK